MTRPLPALFPWNEFFWTGGADGELRFQGCAACGTLRHPPGPICSECRSDETEIVTVVGTATVVGHTTNAHHWLPAMPPPYVVAIVSIDDDPRIRLTTNVVGCDPDEVVIGMRVRVVFEQHDDVWLPLFEPIPGEAAASTSPDPDVRSTIRPMIRTDKFEDRSVISGIGMSQVGRRLMVDPVSLTVDACRAAVDDAGLTLDDIDGLSTYPGGSGFDGGHSEGGIFPVEEALQIRPTWISGGGEIPGQAGALIAAMMAVASGLCRHVLCYRTVWESTSAALASSGHGPTRLTGDMMSFRLPFGAASAANWIGMFANNYLHHYGASREVLGRIAINARANAALNPNAIYRDPMTMDDYLSARPVSTPFGLYDCDVPCDGSVAIVVSAADTAADLRQPPVRIDAVGTQIIERISWDQGTITHEPQLMGPAAHLWSRSELTTDDVDVALLYDGFTFNCLSWIEALGFCGLGEASDFIGDGARIALTGSLPLNPHGGQLSSGRTHGFGYLYEAVAQLRGAAGARQVSGAQVAVVSTGGGVPSCTMLLTNT